MNVDGIFCAVRFTAEPQNITAFEGETVIFWCMYEGSNALSSWRINNTSYDRTSLNNMRHKYEYHRDWLTVRNVDLSMNSTTFQCEIFLTARSTIGRLTVKPRKL